MIGEGSTLANVKRILKRNKAMDNAICVGSVAAALLFQQVHLPKLHNNPVNMHIPCMVHPCIITCPFSKPHP